jgi:hypothetical protein
MSLRIIETYIQTASENDGNELLLSNLSAPEVQTGTVLTRAMFFSRERTLLDWAVAAQTTIARRAAFIAERSVD